MKTVAGMLLLVVGFTVAAQAQKQNEPAIPAMIVQAKWVMVTTLYGTDYNRLSVSAEDRRAIADVQERIRQWGRYALAYKPEDADIILVVRRGRAASATGGFGVSIGSDHPIGMGPVGGTETGPKEDMLAVFDAHAGVDSSPLWRKLQKDGLVDKLPLFQEFRRTVEAAPKP